MPYIRCMTHAAEAPMSATITSRVAIQARITEWQRQYRSSDYGPTDFLFGNPGATPERVRWFRQN
jgi:hypothetical protein